MLINIVSFTENGKGLARRIQEVLEQEAGQSVLLYDGRTEGWREWCKNAFAHAQVLIFMGAAGIAVRTVAPLLKDKYKDPAVLVIDEQGKYVIPLLSGHIGGANAWAERLAAGIQAEPVITTATDLNGAFAVDVFAVKNHLVISDRNWAREISAAVLRGEPIGFSCERAAYGKWPRELTEKPQKYNISVGIREGCQLVPKAVALGIGCRKGKPAAELEQFLLEQLKNREIALESVKCLASIHQKKEEEGIQAFSEKFQIPFVTFLAEKLQAVPGIYEESGFVAQTVGVGNVCERAAAAALLGKGRILQTEAEAFQEKGKIMQTEAEALQEKGRILQTETGIEEIFFLQNKIAENGMTLAIAEKEWSVTFE